MNLQHLKYAVEVERTGSITRAANHLYMNQPHLSKAIRELEESLGIVIFSRTSKGVIPTKRGEEFLTHAKKILAQVEEVEALYHPGKKQRQRFGVSVPRASYISYAFTSFLEELPPEQVLSIDYRETNSLETVRRIYEGENDLGIVRFQLEHERYFLDLIEEKELTAKPLLEFEYQLLLSQEHPLAVQKTITLEELFAYIEVLHGDISLPVARREEETRRQIKVYERGSQLEILSRVPGTYMWVSPMPKDVLERFGLTVKRCDTGKNRHRDMLIYRRGHSLSEEEKRFIDTLFREIREEVS